MEALRRGYLAFYREEGARSPCQEARLKRGARSLLASLPGGWTAGGPRRFDPARLARRCPPRQGDPGLSSSFFPRLARALGVLELLCVNLFLSPWRKEIRTLKTFTGNFVYYVQSVLPEDVVKSLLEEIGYVATTATEFSLVRKLTEEEAEQAAFELFLARIECEDLLEISEDVRDSDLGDLLQKRAQEQWCLGRDIDKKHQSIQGKECVSVRGQSEGQDYHGPQETYQSTLAFKSAENTELRSDVGLRCPTEESPAAISKCFPKQNVDQRSMVASSSNSCIKSSDSEDFLIKYSDIVIGQQPLHLTNLSPKTSAHEARAMGLVETRLVPPASGAQSLNLLSPDASGPQALPILNNETLGNNPLYDYRTREPRRETVESKICDAMKSLDGSDPTDQPKELKGNALQHSSVCLGCDFPQKDEPYALFCNKKLTLSEDHAGQLMYPVEETAPLGQKISKSNIQEFNISRTKLENLPGRNRESFKIDLYSSPNLYCNISDCKHPTVSSTYNRLAVGIPGASEAEKYFKHVEEQTSPLFTVTSEVPYHGGLPASLQCRREGCPLHSSLAPVDETNPEGYVVINKND